MHGLKRPGILVFSGTAISRLPVPLMARLAQLPNVTGVTTNHYGRDEHGFSITPAEEQRLRNALMKAARQDLISERYRRLALDRKDWKAPFRG